MAEEEEDSHLFNIFEFAEQIGNWSQTIINSIVVLNARDVTSNSPNLRQQQTNIIIRGKGPVQRIVAQAVRSNFPLPLLDLPLQSGIQIDADLDRPNNLHRPWGSDGGQQTAYQGQITNTAEDNIRDRCTVMYAKEDDDGSNYLAYASSYCTEQAIALCMSGIVKGDGNATPEKPAIELIFNLQSRATRIKQEFPEKKQSKHNNHKTKNTKKGHKKKLKWAQKRSKRSAIIGYAGEGKRFANDCGLDMCLWVPPFVVGSSLFSSTALSSVLSPDSPQERYTIVDEINHIQSFDQFMKIYQRSYSSYEEQQYRQSVFLANLGRTSKPFHR